MSAPVRGAPTAVALALAAMLCAAAAATQEPEPEAPPGPPEAAETTPQEPEQPPAAPDAESPAAPVPDPDRIRFELPLPEEEGGGTVAGTTSELSYEGSLAVLSGGVELSYQDVKVRAERIEFDLDTEQLEASGDVVFDQGPRRLTGTTMSYNLGTDLGTLTEVTGQVTDDYYFRGSRVEKTGPDTYVVEHGVFTSCSPEDPPWSFRFRRVRVRVDGFARARSATFRAKNFPVVYLPYVLWPVRETRTSGLLVPKPGYSSRRGPSLGLAYFQTLGRSFDTTIELDLFAGGAPLGAAGSGSYLGLGNEFRWRPSETTTGRFEGYAIRDPDLDEVRWRANLAHEARDLPFGFRGVVSIEEASDFDFFRDFERRGDRNSIRQLYSRGFLTKNWSAHSVNILFDNRETLVGTDRLVELRQLPEIEYRLRSKRLGRSPLYLQVRSSAHLLDVERSERLDAAYGRADVLPELTLPVRSAPWLALSVTAGGRFTWWGDSLLTSVERQEDPGDSDFRGESLSRFVPTLTAEVVGPSFSRIFDAGGKNFSKLKHVIEPRFDYRYFDDFDEQERIPLFDEIDNLQGANVGRFSLVHRLLAKPVEERAGAREILSFELFRNYSFDEETPLQFSTDREQQRRAGPLGTLVRFSPSNTTNLRAEATYNTLFGGIESTSFSSSFSLPANNRIGVLWSTRRQPELDVTRTHQIRLSTQIGLVPRRLMLASSVNYDIQRSLLQLQRHILSYQGSCYSLSLEYGDFLNGDRRDREYRFMVTLKNVGTFLDITGGQSEEF
ncbi:MAG TPA: LPS assembly protein LptD [Thermoanaerobaculia bacterium]|nr:LPS assembly protein LptD [Thermoanaerobaculia bacterium]